MGRTNISRDVRRRRRGAGFNAIVAVLLACGVFIFANILSLKLRGRVSFSRLSREDSISRRTSDVLESTAGILGIHPIFELSHPFNRAARHLFEELKEKSEGIEGLSIEGGPLDANHDLDKVTQLLRDYPEAQVNGILVRLEDKSVWLDEFELGASTIDPTDSGTPRVFNGERAVTQAILELTRRGSTPVRFVTGHGEYDPDDVHPIRGASILANALRTNGFDVERTDLSDPSALKTDRGVLVLAGPRTILSQPEIETLSRFLSSGGRLLLMAENSLSGGLSPLLEKWGLRLEPLQNGDPNRTFSCFQYGDHAIVDHLRNVRTSYANPCLVLPADENHSNADAPTATPLAFLPVGGSGLEPVAMAVRHASVDAGPSVQDPRLVVFGDSGMLSNGLLGNGHEGNTLLLLHAIEWLAGSDVPIATVPIDGSETQELAPNSDGRSTSKTICLFFPLSILAFGLILYVPLARKL